MPPAVATPAPAPAPTPTKAPPAAKPAPAAPPPESVQPIDKPVSFDADFDAELDSMDDNKKFAPPEKPKKPEAKPEKKDDPAPEPEPEPDLDGEEPPPVEKKQEPEEPVKPVKAADLRTAYEGLKKRVKEEFEPKVAKLESRIKELETAKPEDHSAVVEELASAKKRLAEIEEDRKFKDYQASEEFKTTYEKPYQEAWQKALADLDELTVESEDGESRKATAQDLMTLANLPLGEARAQARIMFGDAAEDVMAHRRTIKDLFSKQQKALEDAKKNATEREKQLAAQRQIQSQEIDQMWKDTNKALAEKYPKWFAEVEGDSDGNELLRKGFSLADLHFLNVKHLTPEQIELLPPRFRDAIKAKGNLDIKERVALDALLRHKIASHSRLALNLKKANARIAELEKSLADYEQSSPPAGKAGTGGKPVSKTPEQEAQDELDAIDRRNT